MTDSPKGNSGFKSFITTYFIHADLFLIARMPQTIVPIT